MVYKPLAVRVALIAGFRRALPVFRYMIVVAVAVVMWESLQGFPRGVGRVESRLYGFPCFPYPGISMACFLAAQDFAGGNNDAKRTAYISIRSPGAVAAFELRILSRMRQVRKTAILAVSVIGIVLLLGCLWFLSLPIRARASMRLAAIKARSSVKVTAVDRSTAEHRTIRQGNSRFERW